MLSKIYPHPARTDTSLPLPHMLIWRGKFLKSHPQFELIFLTRSKSSTFFSRLSKATCVNGKRFYKDCLRQRNLCGKARGAQADARLMAHICKYSGMIMYRKEIWEKTFKKTLKFSNCRERIRKQIRLRLKKKHFRLSSSRKDLFMNRVFCRTCSSEERQETNVDLTFKSLHQSE